MPFQGSLYLADDLAVHATARAQAVFHGRMNTYIAHLVRKDRDTGGALDVFDDEQLARWIAGERAMLGMAREALIVLNAADAAKREAAARTLATTVIEAALRPRGTGPAAKEELGLVAEPPTPPPPARKAPPRRKKKE